MTTKKLNASNILSISKHEFSFHKIIVTTPDNQEFEVQIQEKLNDTAIMNLISDLVERSNYCTENNIEFNEILNTYFLLIKYFTDIKFNTYKSIEKQYTHELEIVNCLFDLGLFDQIISRFDKGTMEKIQDSLEKYSKQLKAVSNNKLKEILESEYQAEVEIENEKEL